MPPLAAEPDQPLRRGRLERSLSRERVRALLGGADAGVSVAEQAAI